MSTTVRSKGTRHIWQPLKIVGLATTVLDVPLSAFISLIHGAGSTASIAKYFPSLFEEAIARICKITQVTE